ncbi:hypothetical protein S101446_01285 [Komagataeibacter europaeus]|nr:hypothetical protein S101446_01285 [Komagataeibacter europaeus]
MVCETVFPNGHIPFHLNKNECLDPSAILLAIDVCSKSNKFAVDVIYALLSQVDDLNDKIRLLSQEKQRYQSPACGQPSDSNVG